jgi:hypothetical protein
MKKLVVVLVAVCGLAVVGNASAEELGDRNTVAIMGGGLVQVQSAPNGTESTVVLGSARVAWFFADGISVFIGPDFAHSKWESDPHSQQTGHSVGGAVGIGGLVDLSERVSLWPQVEFSFSAEKSSMSGVSYTMAADGSQIANPYSYDNDSTSYGVSARVPVLLKLSKHTFASISFASAQYMKRTGNGMTSHSAGLALNAGVGIGIGGWF